MILVSILIAIVALLTCLAVWKMRARGESTSGVTIELAQAYPEGAAVHIMMIASDGRRFDLVLDPLHAHRFSSDLLHSSARARLPGAGASEG